MSDVVATVPMGGWAAWIAEGDLPGEAAFYDSHFWLPGVPKGIARGDRFYIVAHGKLRGYAPVTGWEHFCELNRDRACVIREGGAVAVTIPEPINGFRGWQYRWWSRRTEVPFPDWQRP